MARSLWKGPFVDGYLIKKADKVKASTRNEVVKTWSRRSTIIPQFVGVTFGVHNGHKLGEFSPTRTFNGHGGADKKATRK